MAKTELEKAREELEQILETKRDVLRRGQEVQQGGKTLRRPTLHQLAAEEREVRARIKRLRGMTVRRMVPRE